MENLREKITNIILKVAMAHHDDISKDDEDMADDAALEILALLPPKMSEEEIEKILPSADEYHSKLYKMHYDHSSIRERLSAYKDALGDIAKALSGKISKNEETLVASHTHNFIYIKETERYICDKCGLKIPEPSKPISNSGECKDCPYNDCTYLKENDCSKVRKVPEELEKDVRTSKPIKPSKEIGPIGYEQFEGKTRTGEIILIVDKLNEVIDHLNKRENK